MKGQDYPAAVQLYDESIKADDSFVPAWQMKMAALDKLGKKDEEDACLDKVLQLKQDSGLDATVVGAYLRAAGLANIGEYEKSVQAFDKVLAKDLGRYTKLAWHEKGDALLYGLKRAAEAVACYEKSLGLDDQDKLAWGNKGYAEFILKNYDAALECFKNGTRIDDQDDVLWHNRAVILVYMERYEEALPAFDRALQLNPKRADSWTWKGKALEALGKKDEAAGCYAKADELNGKK